MKNSKWILSAIVALAATACAPTASQLKQAIEKDPSIVFVAIEKDPEKFIEVVNKAAQEAQRKAQQKAQEDESKSREEEFKNPLKPEINESRILFGKKDAPVTIVEYSDFQCPFCGRAFGTVKQLESEYKDQIRIIFKNMPLDFHPMAMPAAKYFEAITHQGMDKAQKFHDYVFSHQAELNVKKDALLKEAAKKAGADMKKLEKDLNDPSIMAEINKDIDEAKKFNITGTPGFIINGVSLRGAYPIEEFKSIIDRQLKDSKK